MRLPCLLLLGAACGVLPAQDGVFAEPVALEVEGLQAGSILHADLDGDGLRDLLNGFSRMWIHRNEGTDDRPRWAQRTELLPGGSRFPVPDE